MHRGTKRRLVQILVFQLFFPTLPNFFILILTDLEWKMIYVGCAESEEFDQVLDTIYVGPIPEGRHMFVFQVTIIC